MDLEQWWYLSFSEDTGADEPVFNGGCLIEADDFLPAVVLSHRLKINPGGQVAGFVLSTDCLPPESFRNRLLTKNEIDKIWPDGATSIN